MTEGSEGSTGLTFTVSNSTDVSEEIKAEGLDKPSQDSQASKTSKITKTAKAPKSPKPRPKTIPGASKTPKAPKVKKARKPPPDPSPPSSDSDEEELLGGNEGEEDDEDDILLGDDDDEEEPSPPPSPPPSRRKAPRKPRAPKNPRALRQKSEVSFDSDKVEEDWNDFILFLKEKKASSSVARELAANQSHYSRSLQHLDENLEIIKRMGNVRFKPESELTLDDYLAWYVVDSGKVVLPKGALDLVDPKAVKVKRQVVAQQLGEINDKAKSPDTPNTPDPLPQIVPGFFSLARWGF